MGKGHSVDSSFIVWASYSIVGRRMNKGCLQLHATKVIQEYSISVAEKIDIQALIVAVPRTKPLRRDEKYVDLYINKQTNNPSILITNWVCVCCIAVES